MLIYIVRHGETRANEQGYLQGWSNELNENGIRLAKITGREMKDIKFDGLAQSEMRSVLRTDRDI